MIKGSTSSRLISRIGVAAFEPAGFVFERLQPIEEVTDLSLASYARRVG
jgi:hypothetical protein